MATKFVSTTEYIFLTILGLYHNLEFFLRFAGYKVSIVRSKLRIVRIKVRIVRRKGRTAKCNVSRLSKLQYIDSKLQDINPELHDINSRLQEKSQIS